MKNHRWCWYIKAGPGDLGLCAKTQLADVWGELERYPRWHGERAALRMRGAARCLGQRLRASREALANAERELDRMMAERAEWEARAAELVGGKRKVSR